MRERGAVLIWVLIALPVLLGLAAFVVNLAINYTAIEQARGFTRLLALTSLEGFYEVVDDIGSTEGSNAFLEQAAPALLARVNEVARRNRLTGHREKEFLDFRFPWDEAGNVGGVLTPGMYYDAASLPVAGCSELPCFLPADVGALTSRAQIREGINAFRVEANFVDGLAMKLFSFFLGDPVQEIRVCAYSAAVRRNLMFAVDISGSSVANTHIRRTVPEQIANPELGRGAYFAYPDYQVYDPSLPPNLDAVCFGVGPETAAQYCDWHFLKNYPLGAPERRPVGEANTKKHYYDDFVPSDDEVTDRVVVTGPSNDEQYGETEDYEDADFHPLPSMYPNDALVGRAFFVDKYTAPEPLTSIFDALSAGVQELVSRNIAGEKGGYVFFERSLTWTRIVNLTHNTDYLSAIATNAPRTVAGRSVPIRELFGIFPSGLRSEDFTDVYLALKEAVTQLKTNKGTLNGAPTIDGVVYVGDFLPNCVARKHLPSHDQACGECRTGDAPCSAECEERHCADDYTHFEAAVRELWELIANEYIPNRVTLNVVLLGEDVGPHTVDIVHPDPDENGRCMIDEEARRYGREFMQGGDRSGVMPANRALYYSNRSKDTPFFQAGYEAYRMVRATGGIIRSVLASPAGCAPDNSCQNGKRRERDRQCRSQRDQLAGYIPEIVGAGVPFRIVSTDCSF